MRRCITVLAIVPLFACVVTICGCKGSSSTPAPLGMGGGTGPALINGSYLEELQCWGGQPPYTWSISIGSLPTGLDLDTATGKISGTSTDLGTWPFTVRLEDHKSPPEYVEKEFTINVVELTVKPGPATPLSALIPTLCQDTVIMQFRLRAATGISALTVTGITFTASGSGNDSTDVENVRLFIDNNHDGKLDAGDTQLGTSQTYSADNGTVPFTDFDPSFSIDPAELVYLILVYDFTKNAWPEEEFQASIASITDVVVADAHPLAGPPVQGTMQKMRYPNWVRRTPTVRDSGGNPVTLLPRTDHDWAYDSVRKVFVMFSGVPVAVQNETWEYNGATQEWIRAGTDPDPSDPPPCTRQNHAMCFIKDPPHTLMFGGRVALSMRTYVLDDSCRYVAGEWGGIMGYETAQSNTFNPYHWNYYHLSPCPGRREYHAIEYHEAAGVAVMYGGTSWQSSPPEYADTWTTTGDPNLPTGYNAAGDPLGYGVIWQQLYTDSAPGKRYSHAMVYDSTNERIIMFGGYRSTASPFLLNDTWELTSDLAWNILSPVHSAPARKNHDMMYDPEREVMILFGGSTGSGSMFSDTWEFAQTEREGSNYDWIQMKPNDSPSARDGQVMGWDPDREIPRNTYDTLYKIPGHVGKVQKGVGVLFGGYNNNDTWEYLR